jgi:hypothetical protein
VYLIFALAPFYFGGRTQHEILSWDFYLLRVVERVVEVVETGKVLEVEVLELLPLHARALIDRAHLVEKVLDGGRQLVLFWDGEGQRG